MVHHHGRRFIVLEHQYGRRDAMWTFYVHFLDTGTSLLLTTADNVSVTRIPCLCLSHTYFIFNRKFKLFLLIIFLKKQKMYAYKGIGNPNRSSFVKKGLVVSNKKVP